MSSTSYHFADPQEARSYIAKWGPRLLGKRVDFVQTNYRRVTFATMTDEDACWVAAKLWEMEQERRGRHHGH